MKYTGIDLQSNNSVISVIDETDKVIAQERLPNDLARILEFLEPHEADMADERHAQNKTPNHNRLGAEILGCDIQGDASALTTLS